LYIGRKGRDAALGADLSRLRPETKSAKFADLIRRWAPEMLAPYRRQISGTADIASRLASTECR